MAVLTRKSNQPVGQTPVDRSVLLLASFWNFLGLLNPL